MRFIKLIFIVCYLWNGIPTANAQLSKKSLTRQEAYSYSNLVGNYLDAHDTGVINKSELVMMFLEMDTIGRVVKINFLADNKEDKSLYGVLKGITPAYFNDKRIIYNAREKTIIFPIYSLAYWADNNNYIDKISKSFPDPFFTDDMSATVLESFNFIQVNGTTHVVGVPKPEPRKPCISSDPAIAKKKKISDKEAIYAEVINQLYDYQPASIVISDSTVNQDILKKNYTEIAEDFLRKPRERHFWQIGLDSTWAQTLIKADEKKASLSNNKLLTFKPQCVYIRFISNDSLKKATKNMGHYGFENTFKVRDRVSVSSIILIENRAIVEINRMCGSLCGEGMLYFLEKRNGKWVVVTTMRLWIS